MFIFAYPDRELEKDVLIFPSRRFHELVQRMPQEKSGKVALYISKGRNGGGWYVMLGRRKFTRLDGTTCVDVTQYCNNFELLS